jgi:hypothetical protein
MIGLDILNPSSVFVPRSFLNSSFAFAFGFALG